MTDQDIVNATGLSDSDATDLVKKHQAYLSSLNPAQLDVVNRALPTPDDAAAAVGPDCTPDDLNAFVSKRTNNKVVSSALSVPMPVDDMH